MSHTVFPILYVPDLSRALRLYRDLLSMEDTYRFPPQGEPVFVALRYGEGAIALGTYDPVPGLDGRRLAPPREGRGFELCCYVDDVDAMVAKLRHEGVPVLVEPVDQPWGERVACVEDPAGNSVMLTAKISSKA